MQNDSVTRFIDPGGLPREDDDDAPQLVVLEGSCPGVRVTLGGPVTTVGRKPDNTLVLDSSSISKYHGRIRREGASFYVEDLGSLNGILLNGIRLDKEKPQLLCHGDTLRLSDHLLLFRNPHRLVDPMGMSTITFDVSKVRAEVDQLFADMPEIERREKSGQDGTGPDRARPSS